MAIITIDARKYFDFGIGTYIRHLVDNLAKLRSRHSFRLLISPGDEKQIVPPSGWAVKVVPYGKYSVSEFFLLGRSLKSSGAASLFHSPHYTLPLGLKNPSVVTIHDLIPLRFPQLFSPAQRLYAYAMMGHAVRDARYVLTDSEFTRQDILRSFDVRAEKVVAVHLGIDPRFRPLSQGEKQKFRVRRNLTRPYVLFVGNPKPHKGILILLRAFTRIAAAFPTLDLVFVGGKPTRDSSIRLAVQAAGIGQRVKELEHISTEYLVRVYNCAEMLVMPSLYEGFGLPALEAMACGTCAVVSGAASLPEVVGDAALVFQTGNAESLEVSMESILRDEGLRKRLIDKGKRQVRRFSWEEAAKRTMDIYESVLAEKRTV